jgi:hypothetical protein
MKPLRTIPRADKALLAALIISYDSTDLKNVVKESKITFAVA